MERTYRPSDLHTLLVAYSIGTVRNQVMPTFCPQSGIVSLDRPRMVVKAV